LKRQDGTTYIFVSHDLAVVKAISDRVAVLYQGRICEIGPVVAVYSAPFHPYTDAHASLAPPAKLIYQLHRKSHPGISSIAIFRTLICNFAAKEAYQMIPNIRALLAPTGRLCFGRNVTNHSAIFIASDATSTNQFRDKILLIATPMRCGGIGLNGALNHA
jgi:energy-coupling factor transporter ATP-binding protein EcfA2